MKSGQTISVGLVGLGGYGGFYIERLLDRAAEFGVELSGAVDPLAEACPRLPEFRERGIPVYSDVDSFFANQSADLMIISSPIHCHAEQSIKAMEAGAHVLCEKPASGSLADAEAMADTSARTGKFCAIGYQWSFSDAVTSLKSDILAGILGMPVRFKTLVLWPRPKSYYARCDWAGKRMTPDKQLVMDSPVNNACAHFWHNMLFLAGDQPSKAADITCIKSDLYRAKPIEMFDTAALRCMSENGAEILFYTTHSCTSTIGPLSIFEFSEAWVDYRSDEGFVARFHNGKTRNYGDPNADQGDNKLKACLDAVRHSRPLPCTIDSALPHARGVAMLGAEERTVTPFLPENIVHREMPSGDTLIFARGIENTLIQCYANNLLPTEAYPASIQM